VNGGDQMKMRNIVGDKRGLWEDKWGIFGRLGL